MRPIFVSYFTTGTPYAEEATGLVETLDKFGLTSDVVGVPSLGSWHLNCGYKPQFMMGMMRKWPGVPLVWIDADARIRRLPKFFNRLGEFDFACHRRGGSELLSGTLYFGPTMWARKLLACWQVECESNPTRWDQVSLDAAVSSLPLVKVADIPASYVRICDADDMGDEIVIEHLQASRRLRDYAYLQPGEVPA